LETAARALLGLHQGTGLAVTYLCATCRHLSVVVDIPPLALPLTLRTELCLGLQRGAACGAGDVMAWARGRRRGGAEGAEGVDVDYRGLAAATKRGAAAQPRRLGSDGVCQ